MSHLRWFFFQVKTQLSYHVFIIILTACFGLDSGPTSSRKTYLRILYSVIYKMRSDHISFSLNFSIVYIGSLKSGIIAYT